jgi:EmrB/QacA subfamily drug resistance transporter
VTTPTTVEPPRAEKAKGEHHGLIMAGLMLGILLSALDQTVVGTSLPKIVGELGDFQYFPQLITSYLLASVIVIPVAGKFSDLYGRRPIYLLGMATFLLGSALCGLAGEWGSWNVGGVAVSGMWQLILFRFIQGLGGGAIFPVALATIADLYSPSERGRVQGLFGAVFGFASVIGPFLGGWIVDSVHIGDISSWRWVFYVNVPVGIAGISMVATHFPRKVPNAGIKIDWWGVGTITAALTAIVVVASLGGVTYDWGSPQILGLIAFALLMTAGFVYAESRAADPLIPLGLWKESIFTVSSIASILMGSSMFGVIAFMPTYMQGVVGISATYSGAVLVPLTLMLVAGSLISGQLMKRFGYKPFTVSGCLIAASAFFGLWYMNTQGIPPIWLAILVMMWLGIGLGFTIQTFTVAVQNALERRHVGTGTAAITLFRSLGATVGIAALGAILNTNVRRELPPRVASSPPAVQGIYSGVLNNQYIGGKPENVPQILVATPDQIQPIQAALAAHHVPPGAFAQFLDVVKDAFNASIGSVWLAGAFIALGGFVVVLFLKGKRLKTAEEYHGSQPAAAAMH